MATRKFTIQNSCQIALTASSVFLGFFLLSFFWMNIFVVSSVPNTNAAGSPLMSDSSPTLSLSLTQTDVNINASQTSSTPASTSVDVLTTTNNPYGYNLSINMADANTCLRHSSVSATECGSIPANKKFQPGDPTTAKNWGWSIDGGTTWAIPQDDVGTDILGDFAAGPYTDHSQTITYGAKTDMSLNVGVYSGDTIVTVLGNTIPAPAIISVSPDRGAAGTEITITGTNFSTAYAVTVGGADCDNPIILSDTQISCTAPSSIAFDPYTKAANIEVSTWGGETECIDCFAHAVIYMQNWKGCLDIPTPAYTTTDWAPYTQTLRDNRDGRSYTVRKLPDGNCWMIDNLRLGSTTGTMLLTSDDTDLNVARAGVTDNVGTLEFTLPQLVTSGAMDYDNPGVYGPVTDDTETGATNYGYLYNWSAVSAGESTMTMSYGSNNAQNSICPAGWQLPSMISDIAD